MKIASVTRHYVYVPYEAPVAPYWGWRAPCYGAHAVLVEVITDEGLIGIGETAGRESLAFHGRCAESVLGMDPLDVVHNVQTLRAMGETPIAVSGVEMAMWDIMGKVAGLPLHALLGGRVRESVPLCGLMGVKPPDEAAETAAEYLETWGFRTIKTKAGRDIEEDASIARALQDRVGGEVKFRFDANQSYTPENVQKIAEVYRDVAIEYFEQPLPEADLEASARVRESTGLPIALNESVSDARSVMAIAQARAADALVPDIPDAGGILEIVRLAAVAQAADLPCAHHCWHDLGVKTAAMSHVVTALPAFSLASDTTYHGLEADVITRPFEIHGGAIQAPESPGLGVELDMDVIDRFRKREID